MINLERKFTPEIQLAISDYEAEFTDEVTYGLGLDFFPDVENATDNNVPLVATLGIYLEIPHTEETVISGSIFVPPQLETEQVYKAVFDSLVALRQQRSTAVVSDI